MVMMIIKNVTLGRYILNRLWSLYLWGGEVLYRQSQNSYKLCVKIQFLIAKMKTLTGSIGVDVDLSEIRNSLIHAHTYIDHINERCIMLKSNC